MTAMLSSAPSSQFEFLPPRRKGLALVSRPVGSRSATLHAYAASQLGAELIATYGAGRGSSSASAWMLLSGLEIHLGSSVLAPDLLGWRRERLPRPWDTRPIDVVPDWICEVTSPSNGRHDRLVKARLYAERGVPAVWLVDPDLRVLEALALERGRWVDAGRHGDGDVARIPPFDAIELDVGRLFPPLDAASDPAPGAPPPDPSEST